jgi:ubiquinone/menaquinone biosynthesis C-methylase UbiE
VQKKCTYTETPLQKIELEEEGSFDRIVDIGAGGEGLAARIWKGKVHGVDLRLQEIKEIACQGVRCNWIVADARKLCFQDEVFDFATIWFALMYVPNLDDKIQVLSECKKVLKEYGLLSIKDSVIDCKKDAFVLHAKFLLPNGESVQTTYGVSGAQQNPEWVERILADLGFEVTEKEFNRYWFQIKCKKKG